MKTPIYDLFEAETMLMRKDCSEGLTPDEDIRLNEVQEGIAKYLNEEVGELQCFQDQEEKKEMTIKEMRTSMGMTQTEFGNLFGIPLRSIQNWELEIRKPPEYVITLIEKNLRLVNRIAMLEKELDELKESENKIEE